MDTSPQVSFVVLALLVALIALLLLVIWSIKRHRDPDLSIECDSPIEALVPSIAGLALGTAVEGNRIEILENAAYFDVLVDEILGAKTSVHFETFLWKEG